MRTGSPTGHGCGGGDLTGNNRLDSFGGLWEPDTRPDAESKPPGAAILRDHLRVETPAEEIEAGLAEYYDNHIWAAGVRES